MALELKFPPETLAVDKPAVSYIQLIKGNGSEIKAAVCKVYNRWTFNHWIMSKKPLIKILFLTGFSFPGSCLHLFSGPEISSTSCSAQLLFFFLLQSNIKCNFYTALGNRKLGDYLCIKLKLNIANPLLKVNLIYISVCNFSGPEMSSTPPSRQNT